MTTKSINQLAQEECDTSANEVNRIKEREASVKKAWRQIAYDLGEQACTVENVAKMANLPEAYVLFVCTNVGYALS